MTISEGVVGNRIICTVNTQDRTWELHFKKSIIAEGFYKIADGDLMIHEKGKVICTKCLETGEVECEHELYEFGRDLKERGKCHVCGLGLYWHEIIDDGMVVPDIDDWDYDSEPTESILNLICKAENEDKEDD